MRWFMAGGIVFFSYEWFENARGNFDALIVLIALDLVLAFLFVILTEPRDAKVRRLSRRAKEAAAQHGLGHWVVGVRWTGWRYLLPALLICDMVVPVVRTIVTPPGFHPLAIVWSAIVLTPAAWWLWKVVVGAGRRVYVFDNGFIIARGPHCQVFPYRELADTSVWQPEPPSRPHIRLRRGAGRRLFINQEMAVGAIAARVPHVEE